MLNPYKTGCVAIEQLGGATSNGQQITKCLKYYFLDNKSCFDCPNNWLCDGTGSKTDCSIDNPKSATKCFMGEILGCLANFGLFGSECVSCLINDPRAQNANQCDGLKPTSCLPNFYLNKELKCVTCSEADNMMTCSGGKVLQCSPGYVPDSLGQKCLKCQSTYEFE